MENLTVVALGSNLGDSEQILEDAAKWLRKFAVPGTFRCSSWWRSDPVDCPPQSPAFLNGVVVFVARPGLTPEVLLENLKKRERTQGRPESRARHRPRTLDLDLVQFGAERRESPRLTLPHPRAHLRRFVLAPMAELTPELVLPGQVRTVGELLKECPPQGIVRPYSQSQSEAT